MDAARNSPVVTWWKLAVISSHLNYYESVAKFRFRRSRAIQSNIAEMRGRIGTLTRYLHVFRPEWVAAGVYYISVAHAQCGSIESCQWP